MGALKSFFKGSESTRQPQQLLIDLTRFSCGQSKLGGSIAPADYFAAVLRKREVFDDKANGIEIGITEGVFDYAVVTLAHFQGQFAKDNKPLTLSTKTTEADILALFRHPYWTDRSDDEVIMFYEYQRGAVELQFEFSNSQTLSFITLTRNGVFSKAEQRKAYRVTKPWPP